MTEQFFVIKCHRLTNKDIRTHCEAYAMKAWTREKNHKQQTM